LRGLSVAAASGYYGLGSAFLNSIAPSFNVTAVGDVQSYQWLFEAPKYAGNKPDVTFTTPTADKTDITRFGAPDWSPNVVLERVSFQNVF
jgi:hypothetical protein